MSLMVYFLAVADAEISAKKFGVRNIYSSTGT